MLLTPDRDRSHFASSKADALGSWAHAALGDWGVLWNSFCEQPEAELAQAQAQIMALEQAGGHNPHEAYWLDLWRHELAHILEIRQCQATEQPYQLPPDLVAAAQRRPVDLATSHGIVLRCEWRLHHGRVAWDGTHFAQVVQPWAVEALDAYHESSQELHQRRHRDLGQWMATQLVWATAPELLEPLAQKVGEHCLNHRDEYEPEWGKHLACDLDWWEQRTGIDLGLAHGGKILLVEARRKGFKKPRTQW